MKSDIQILADKLDKINITSDVEKCEDCGNANTELLKSNACAESTCTNHTCCYKYVCKNGCKLKCDKCKKNVISPYCCHGWRSAVVCKCGNKIEPNFLWWGLEPKIYCNRYCDGYCFIDDETDYE